MRVIGLDVGGANLKASDGERQSWSQAFRLWQQPDRLGEALRSLLSRFARPHRLAVTMTGELADCFASKAEGVERILTALEQAMDVPIHVWQRPGEFVSPTEAREFPLLAAAANWHALATWAGRMTPEGTALIIDVGSTTSDVIPLVDGLPVARGGSDVERLAAGELVYTGVRRTPVCAVTASVRAGDQETPLAAEFFATMHDVYLILGAAAENPASCDTADGRPATIDCARGRLARMLCCDRNEIRDGDLAAVAAQLAGRQQDTLSDAVSRVLSALPCRPAAILLAGEGEQMARKALANLTISAMTPLLSLSDSLGPEHSVAACAYALARLGSERIS